MFKNKIFTNWFIIALLCSLGAVAIIIFIAAIIYFSFYQRVDTSTAINIAFTLVLAAAPIIAVIIEFFMWKKNKRAPVVEEFMKAKLALFIILLALSLIKEILSVLILESHLILNQALFGLTTLVACDRVLSYAKSIHEEKRRKKKKAKEKEKLNEAGTVS